MKPEDFEHFQYLFGLYKYRLGPDLNGALLLRECLAMDTDISRPIYGEEMEEPTEDQLVRAISTACVKRQHSRLHSG